MNLKRTIIPAVVSTCCLHFATAQKNTSITLQQALQMAESNYPGIKAKQAQLSGSMARISSAKTDYLPEFTVMDQYLYSTNNGMNGTYYSEAGLAIPTSGGVRKDNLYQPVWGSFTTLFVDWKFFTFGKVRAGVNFSKQEMNQANADYQNEVFQHKIKVADTYYLLLMAEKLTSVQEENLKRADEFRKAVNAYAQSGLRPGADSSYTNAEYAKARISLTQSRQYEKSLRYKLSELIGNSTGNISADTLDAFSKIPANTLIDSTKINSHPLLKLYQTEIELSRIRTQIIQRSFYPNLSLIGAGWARGSGISNSDNSYNTDMASGIPYQTYNYMAGVSFRWNLLNYAKVHYDTEFERWQTQRFQYLYDEQSLIIKRQIDDAEMQFSTALEQAQLAPVQLTSAKDSYNQAEARYKSGLASFPELTQSYYILNRAETDMAVAYSNAWRALILKAAAAGDINMIINNK
ncbi:MAG: TolC family protein [Bacteroidia bacterium]